MKKSVESNPLALGSLVASVPGEVRVGPILVIPDILTELGVSPQRASTQAGVDPRLFQDPENRIQIETLGRLLETCVTFTGCHHFVLLVGERFDLRSFGLLGYLLRNSATVGEAMRSLLLTSNFTTGARSVLLCLL